MEIKAIPRKWGNSLAIILPKKIVDKNRIRENQEIKIEIKENPTAETIFGMLPKWKKSTQKIKDDMRKAW